MKRALDKNGSSLFSTLCTDWYSWAGLLEQVTRFHLKWETQEFSMDFWPNCWWVGESTNNLKRIQQPKWICSSWISDIRNIHDGCYHVLNFSLDSFPFHRSTHTHTQQTLTTWPFRWEALLSAFTFSWLPQYDRDVHNHLAVMTSTFLSLSPRTTISHFSFFFHYAGIHEFP